MSTQHRSICPVKMNWRTDTLSAARLWFHGAMKHLIMNQLMTSSRQFMNNQNLQDKEAVVFTETEVRWHYVMIRNISSVSLSVNMRGRVVLLHLSCCTGSDWRWVQIMSVWTVCSHSSDDHRSQISSVQHVVTDFWIKRLNVVFLSCLKKHLRNTLFGLKPRCRQVYCLEMCPGLITLHYITFHYIEGI